MLICTLGQQEISRIVGGEGDKILWVCSCERGNPGIGTGPGLYPCNHLKTFWTSFEKFRRPPERAIFTEEGARAAVQNCTCLRAKGKKLVRSQIKTAEPTAAALPAPPGSNVFPCPECGTRLKYKQCCQLCPCGSGKRVRDCHPIKVLPVAPEPVVGPSAPKPEPPKAELQKQARRKERIAQLEKRALDHRVTDFILEQTRQIEEIRKRASRLSRASLALKRKAGNARTREAAGERKQALAYWAKALLYRERVRFLQKEMRAQLAAWRKQRETQ